ncbi:hypothetical protein [Sorangium cellulosum]|uniref:hypothetical protein n=1 Tax=Sorangium cellulosum TaxID=56 RepID=UPI001F486583|nr:hypothetical protein [Sorangium cellulosum]
MASHPSGRVDRWLCHPVYFRAVLVLAAVLAAPSIAVGFYADDYHFFNYLAEKYPGSPRWYDLYRFFTGDARATQALIEMSGVPWWTDPEIRIHLVRPLSSALLSLEHALFGEVPLPYHLVSIALYVALSRPSVSCSSACSPAGPARSRCCSSPSTRATQGRPAGSPASTCCSARSPWCSGCSPTSVIARRDGGPGGTSVRSASSSGC